MKLFISWSGERSQAFAQAVHQWLPMVLHYVDPWLSNSDIAAGDRWANEVAKELEASKFGVICITRENIASPWILFEAGALAKFMQEGRVIPLLLDVEFKDITGPLAQFQAKKVERDGLCDVINSINQFSEIKVPETRLPNLFETLWPVLEKKVGDIPKNPTPAKQNRPQHEVLEELVASIRGLDVRFRETVEDASRVRRRRPRFHPMMMNEMLHRMDLGEQDPTRFLLLASILRDDLPWLYELGVDAYRASTGANTAKAKEAQRRFLSALEMVRRGPFMEMVGDKESYYAIEEMMHMVHVLQEAPTSKPREPRLHLKQRPPKSPEK
ncbi:toll/interleukin-1 receptor domain-containing protein [Methylocystis suflitae]|uniref:toll/interleukin-1 receptor domain-containing protein n=1 Tax=Methylocystis suflitae TaxID=2951405 RepID=UPI00210DCAAE|nr:toll/interleukin-1 receptor domain-containing protein [Methylocystis suflitae]MCQ4189233.1 toll/interleukin-1 receptor domain-containing protein [Methylocystis suflitae]